MQKFCGANIYQTVGADSIPAPISIFAIIGNGRFRADIEAAPAFQFSLRAEPDKTPWAAHGGYITLIQRRIDPVQGFEPGLQWLSRKRLPVFFQ